MSLNKKQRAFRITTQFVKTELPPSLETELNSIIIEKSTSQIKTPKEIDEGMPLLGWGAVPMGIIVHNMERCSYIVEKGIRPTPLKYGYHGTSSAFHDSIQKNGLDSGRNIEVNSGVMERSGKNESVGFCYTTSYETAESFATITKQKIDKNSGNFVKDIKESVSDFNSDNNGNIVYRLGLTTSMVYNGLGLQERTPANKLDMTIDGKNWYPADKFKVEKSPYGTFSVVPDYRHPEIQARDAALRWETRNIFQKAIDTTLNRKPPPSCTTAPHLNSTSNSLPLQSNSVSHQVPEQKREAARESINNNPPNTLQTSTETLNSTTVNDQKTSPYANMNQLHDTHPYLKNAVAVEAQKPATPNDFKPVVAIAEDETTKSQSKTNPYDNIDALHESLPELKNAVAVEARKPKVTVIDYKTQLNELKSSSEKMHDLSKEEMDVNQEQKNNL